MGTLTEDQLVRQKAGSAEQSKKYNPGGVYVLRRFDEDTEEWLPEVTMIVKEHPKFGTAQADALVRLGFRWKREATVEELKPIGFLPEPPKKGSVEELFAGNMVSKEKYDALEARLLALETSKAPAPSAEKPLKLMNKDSLMQKAEEWNVLVPEGATNKEIVELIELAQSENPLT